MRPELQEIETIERYLENKMNSDEKQAFEQELAQNKDLQEKLAFQKKMSRRLALSPLYTLLDEVHSEFVQTHTLTKTGKPGFLKGLLGKGFLNTLLIGVGSMAAIGSIVYFMATKQKESLTSKVNSEKESLLNQANFAADQTLNFEAKKDTLSAFQRNSENKINQVIKTTSLSAFYTQNRNPTQNFTITTKKGINSKSWGVRYKKVVL